jgi:anti-sigma regulatory factor (Ser/Thr protein kinase)
MDDGGAPGPSEPRFECELPANTRSLARLRARFAGWLTAIGVGDFVRRDLVLTISELATASLEDVEGGKGGQRLRARAWRDDAGVAIEVSDDRGPLDARVRSPDPGDRGRGLAIVATLADVLSVRETEGGRTMRARIGWEHLAAQPVSK